MEKPLLELRHASARYNGTPVLREIDLTVRAGERVALVGESGAGKSTLLDLLYREHRDQATLVPQDHGLVRTLSVFHNVYMGRLDHHRLWYNLANLVRPWPSEVAAVGAVLDEVGLRDKLFSAVGELSGGQRQRTAVARALYQGGAVLLGDEPVSAVDERQSGRVLEAINRTYATVVLAMHDVDLALRYTGRVIGVKDGRVELDEPCARLRAADLRGFYRA